MLKIRDIQVGTGGEVFASEDVNLDRDVSAVATDSRLVREGDLFVAVPGERVDGHTFIPGAIASGARVVLLKDLPPDPPPDGVVFVRVADTVKALGKLATYWREKMPARVVAITGSVGKTSTKEAMAFVLSSKFVTLKSQKSYNTEVTFPIGVLALTPDVEIAVLEMGGSWAMGEIEYLCSIAKPKIGVVTNVEHVHIERMGSLEAIAENKSELVASLPPDGLAVLNYDNERVRQMARRARCKVLWYGLDKAAAIRATEIESQGLEGIRFRLHIYNNYYYVKAPILGSHSIHTVLAAVAVARAEGMDDTQIITAVQNLPPGLRLIVNRGINGSTIIDDTYNASPASTIAALNLLGETKGRRIAVLGDMAELGWFTEEGHVKVGARAAQVCDLLYTVGPLGQIIARGAVDAGMAPSSTVQLDGVEQAEPMLRKALHEGDVVLLKGSRILELDKLAASLTVPGEVRS